MLTNEDIRTVYNKLQARTLHPSGSWDRAGRWYASNADLICVRSPSRKWPYSQMSACRTLKYVKRVAEKYDCKTIEELIRMV